MYPSPEPTVDGAVKMLQGYFLFFVYISYGGDILFVVFLKCSVQIY
jgi:hypothetical protein